MANESPPRQTPPSSLSAYVYRNGILMPARYLHSPTRARSACIYLVLLRSLQRKTSQKDRRQDRFAVHKLRVKLNTWGRGSGEIRNRIFRVKSPTYLALIDPFTIGVFFRVKSRGKADQLERRYDLNAIAVVTLGPTFARRDNIVEQEQIDIISYRHQVRCF